MNSTAGRCECGCGGQTGYRNGARNRWIKNHDKRRSSYYAIDDETGCWDWTGAMHPNGYAYGWDPSLGRSTFAHRTYYERAHGPIPVDREIHHRCENKRCVNPSHLVAVTKLEHAAVTFSPGARKLTPDQVAEIRERSERGASQKALGLEFGVTKQAVWAIVHRVNWAREAA